jgi:hypothetical protein
MPGNVFSPGGVQLTDFPKIGHLGRTLMPHASDDASLVQHENPCHLQAIAHDPTQAVPKYDTGKKGTPKDEWAKQFAQRSQMKIASVI